MGENVALFKYSSGFWINPPPQHVHCVFEIVWHMEAGVPLKD